MGTPTPLGQREDPGCHPPNLGATRLTQISIVPPAELPTATEAQVKGLLIRAPQLVPTFNGSKGFLGIAVGDKAIVVPGARGEERRSAAVQYMFVSIWSALSP